MICCGDGEERKEEKKRKKREKGSSRRKESNNGSETRLNREGREIGGRQFCRPRLVHYHYYCFINITNPMWHSNCSIYSLLHCHSLPIKGPGTSRYLYLGSIRR